MVDLANIITEAYPDLQITIACNWLGTQFIQVIRPRPAYDTLNVSGHRLWVRFRVSDNGLVLTPEGSTEMPGTVPEALEKPLDCRHPDFFEKLHQILRYYLYPN